MCDTNVKSIIEEVDRLTADREEKLVKAVQLLGKYLDSANMRGVLSLEEAHDIHISYMKVVNKRVSNHQELQNALTHIVVSCEAINRRPDNGRTLKESYEIYELCNMFR